MTTATGLREVAISDTRIQQKWPKIFDQGQSPGRATATVTALVNCAVLVDENTRTFVINRSEACVRDMRLKAV